jgi:hypothetical protein
MTRDSKCIVSQKGIPTQFEACHIVPVSEGGDYTESNGLLLSREFHILYDNYLWSINPQTLQVELVKNDPDIVGTIYEYNSKKVNLNPNYLMTINLLNHWERFQKKRLKYI